MKVRAKKNGYYDNKRRREGDVFVLKPISGFKKSGDGKNIPVHYSVDEQFSENWMELVDEHDPKPTKKAAQKQQPVNDDQVI